MKNEKFDFQPIVANIERVKQMKASKKKKPSTSVKPLKFEPSPEDSPLKAEIVRRINELDLTYADIYNYCTEVKDGDVSAGQTLGYNIISGLKNRHTMIDTTLSLLADFLNVDILFVPRETTEESTENDEEDEEDE